MLPMEHGPPVTCPNLSPPLTHKQTPNVKVQVHKHKNYWSHSCVWRSLMRVNNLKVMTTNVTFILITSWIQNLLFSPNFLLHVLQSNHSFPFRPPPSSLPSFPVIPIPPNKVSPLLLPSPLPKPRWHWDRKSLPDLSQVTRWLRGWTMFLCS